MQWRWATSFHTAPSGALLCVEESRVGGPGYKAACGEGGYMGKGGQCQGLCRTRLTWCPAAGDDPVLPGPVSEV
jgi:hypothetical protein